MDHFYLYVILDVFSRYVTGWMVARAECGAGQAPDRGLVRQAEHQPGQLTVHADRGSAMTSSRSPFSWPISASPKRTAAPYVSDDNPYSESQFRTLSTARSFRIARLDPGCPRLLPALLPLV
ncbi:MAG: transposase family protein [Bryobacterales bacterium]|nr:transposase family protein [Bryobacterales bacterium]